ncbi:ApaLI family restriction endonuclease [Streptobacillus moniliformis]|uniref:ApaLI family restriction endonuclease n=1 Tax=Streptobacillus moniliformis TaxID=34105 RepID=UPI0009BD659E|nr:ApaLI family restriction endonuclease [Streptobacillus moniliformis]
MKNIEKIYNKIKELADKYSNNLKFKVDERIEEMKNDDKSHYLIYRVLGVSTKEGELIDIYKNKGRFLYKYAGSFLEEATILCFKHKYTNSKKIKVNNTLSNRPKTFEIDCLVDNKAYEIKWKDTTTDGDHITKEHTRVKVIQSHGYTPIRIMFYYPNRSQAIKIQETLKTLYIGVNGQYYYSDLAWDYIKKETDIDLLGILQKIADERNNCNANK